MVEETIKKYEGMPLYIVDDSYMTIGGLMRIARGYKHTREIDLVVVDYLQLISAPEIKESRVQEISYISRSLKGLAKELKVPVLALSQLSRAVETRQDKRPMLSDLRDSGSLEQDADVVLFVYREDYYKRGGGEEKSEAELIVAKNRNGATGEINMLFDRRKTTFFEI